MTARQVVHSRAIVVDLDSIQKSSLTVARICCAISYASADAELLAEGPVSPIGEVARVLVARPEGIEFV